jgi:large subunit ribosomal protein L9
MKVVLLQNVPKLGQAYDVKEVSEGYAKNFLLARKLAVLASPQVLKGLQVRKNSKNLSEAKKGNVYKSLKNKLLNRTVVIKAKTNGNTLFSGVHEDDIISEVRSTLHLDLEKRWLEIQSPIKSLGVHLVFIKLPTVDKFSIKLNILPL